MSVDLRVEAQIVTALRLDPWQTSHTLLQRCENAKTGADITDTLQFMRRRDRVQCRCTYTGLVWALPSAQAPLDTKPGPMPETLTKRASGRVSRRSTPYLFGLEAEL